MPVNTSWRALRACGSEEARTRFLRGLNVNEQDVEGNSLLHYATREGNREGVAALLGIHGIAVNVANNHGVSPLIDAALDGDIGMVRMLCAANAVRDQVAYNGFTACMAAAQGGHTETVQALRAAGADINLVDNNGVTALVAAALNGHRDTVLAMVQLGANVDHANEEGLTALMAAAQGGHTGTVQALGHAGANVDQLAHNGETALAIARIAGYFETANALQSLALSQGLDAYPDLKASLSCPVGLMLFSGAAGGMSPYGCASGHTFSMGQVAQMQGNPYEHAGAGWGTPLPRPNARIQAVMQTMEHAYDDRDMPAAIRAGRHVAQIRQAALGSAERDYCLEGFLEQATLAAAAAAALAAPASASVAGAGQAAAQPAQAASYHGYLAANPPVSPGPASGPAPGLNGAAPGRGGGRGLG